MHAKVWYCAFLTLCLQPWFFSTVLGDQQALLPADIPLVTRSNYLYAWINRNSVNNPSSSYWPNTRDGAAVQQGWLGTIRVDGISYVWIGKPLNYSGAVANATTSKSVSITSTQTIYTATAGPMSVKITFLTPVEIGNLTRQSIPFSYLAVEASSGDGNSHDVQIYTDITGEWASGHEDTQLKWSSTNTTTSMIHQMSSAQEDNFGDINGVASWGEIYYATPRDDATISYEIDSAAAVRGSFIVNGSLSNSISTTFQSNSKGHSVFGFSKDYGVITSTPSPLVFAIGHNRSPMVQTTSTTGQNTSRYPLYLCNNPKIEDIVDEFLMDYPQALDRAQQLDKRIATDSQRSLPQSSNNYTDLLSLAVRLSYGGMEITVGKSDSGACTMSDIMIFLSDDANLFAPNPGGTQRRTSPVESLYAGFPAYMYIDPTLGALLLEPILKAQVSLNQSYSISDLGSTYPNISTTSQPSQGVEHSSNMLVMNYAYARTTGDLSLLSRYYDLLTKWTDYLIQNTLDPKPQFVMITTSEVRVELTPHRLPADNSDTKNPNLGIKGIIAIKAMSFMSNALNKSDDASTYQSQAALMYQQWKSNGTLSNSMLASYGNNPSWSTGYNLLADRWLDTGVATELYEPQMDILQQNVLSSANFKFGLPVDSESGTNVISAYNMLTAGYMPSASIQSDIVGMLHEYVNDNAVGLFRLSYTQKGDYVAGSASPAMGAMFSLLALDIPVNGSFTQLVSAPRSHASQTRQIVGGVVGGVAAIALLAVLLILCLKACRRRRRLDKLATPDAYVLDERPDQAAHTVPHAAASGLTNSVNSLFVPRPQDVPFPTSRLNTKETQLLRHFVMGGAAHRQPGHDRSYAIIDDTTAGGLTSPTSSAVHSGQRTQQHPVGTERHGLLQEIIHLRGELRVLIDGVPPHYEAAAPTSLGS